MKDDERMKKGFEEVMEGGRNNRIYSVAKEISAKVDNKQVGW